MFGVHRRSRVSQRDKAMLGATWPLTPKINMATWAIFNLQCDVGLSDMRHGGKKYGDARSFGSASLKLGFFF